MKVTYTGPMVDERSFSTEDFERHGITQEGFAFNAANDFTVEISQEAFVFLRDAGEPVLSDEDLPDEEEPEPSEPFDPNEHSVEEVLAHLGQARANDDEDEYNRVLAAEAEGKKRKTLTELVVGA
jgi:hypothetical protein